MGWHLSLVLHGMLINEIGTFFILMMMLLRVRNENIAKSRCAKPNPLRFVPLKVLYLKSSQTVACLFSNLRMI